MQPEPLRNKRLFEAAFKFWAVNVISDDFDDAIGSFAADELTSNLLWSEVVLPPRCFFLVVGHFRTLHSWLCSEEFSSNQNP